jgi:hypothetical protein
MSDAPRRSAASRAEIPRAARVRFAADSYQKATIRAIAADASIDPSMVMRYYGTKAKLFTAAVDVDRSNNPTGSNTCVTPQPEHRARRGRTHTTPPGPRTRRAWACPHPTNTPGHPRQASPPAAARPRPRHRLP